jgi:hypothetical protein
MMETITNRKKYLKPHKKQVKDFMIKSKTQKSTLKPETPVPEDWEVWARNDRLWMAESQRSVAMIDAAQYDMLVAMWAGLEEQQTSAPHSATSLCVLPSTTRV